MPYIWQMPALFYQYKGKKIYYTYRDGNSASSYWFTTEPEDDDIDGDGEFHFDIREVIALITNDSFAKEFAVYKNVDTEKARKCIMRWAIKLNIIKFPEKL